MAQKGELKLLSKTTLSTPVSGGNVTVNPAIGLTATVGEGNTILIWRGDGQSVTRYTERNQKVEAVRWKEDGQFLAVGWSDGVVRLVGLENGKAVHHIPVGDGDVKIQYIAWTRNQTKRKPVKGASNPAWEKLISEELDSNEKMDLVDLPHELTFLEVDTALPKISPLPVSGGSGDDMYVFSVRASLDFVFRPFKSEDTGCVDVMLVGTAGGGIHLSIYDSFVIGSFNYTLPPSIPSPGTLRLCGHGSHADSSTHALLFSAEDSSTTSLYLLPMDLTFIHSSQVNLSLLASKTTTLQNLLRYITQAQTHMVGEWKSTRELPSRFLAGVQEDLQKSSMGSMTIVQALYHTVATGHVFPPVKEWLVDSLAERGHKRWDKAVVSGLENLRNLVHQNLIPALERCGIILSRLLGIARFHEDRDTIGFTPSHISRLLDIVSCLSLVAHKILIHVMEELDLFTAFSSWLRFEIDKLASPSITEELSEREATMDNAKVLTYIQGFLTSSELSLYLGEVDKEDYSNDWGHVEDGSSLLEMLDRQLKRKESGQAYMKALPNLIFLINYLNSRSNSLFKEVAGAEKRNVRFGQPVELPMRKKVWKSDVKMTAKRQKDGVEASTFTALADAKDELTIFRTDTHIINGISGQVSLRACVIQLKDHQIIDFKFLNGDVLLVLYSSPKHPGPFLLPIQYQSSVLPYSTLVEGQAPPTFMAEDGPFSPLPLESDSDFKPLQMEVQESGDQKEDVVARVTLLGRDKILQRTYALPASLWKGL